VLPDHVGHHAQVLRVSQLGPGQDFIGLVVGISSAGGLVTVGPPHICWDILPLLQGAPYFTNITNSQVSPLLLPSRSFLLCIGPVPLHPGLPVLGARGRPLHGVFLDISGIIRILPFNLHILVSGLAWGFLHLLWSTGYVERSGGVGWSLGFSWLYWLVHWGLVLGFDGGGDGGVGVSGHSLPRRCGGSYPSECLLPGTASGGGGGGDLQGSDPGGGDCGPHSGRESPTARVSQRSITRLAELGDRVLDSPADLIPDLHDAASSTLGGICLDYILEKIRRINPAIKSRLVVNFRDCKSFNPGL